MNRRGLLLLIGAAFFFSIMSLLVKVAGERLPSAMMVFARALVTLIISWFMVRRAALSPWGNAKKTLALRGFFGFGGLLLYFFAVTRLPLAEVTVLFNLNPVLTALAAALILKERVGFSLVTGLALGLAGVVLVARPAFLFGTQDGSALVLDEWGVAAALVGACSAAGAYVTVRKLRQTDDPIVIVFYFSFVALPASIPFLILNWVTPTLPEVGLLLLIGVVTQIAQVMLTQGISMVPAGPATAVGYIQIAFAIGWGALLFKEFPGPFAYGGAALILLSVLVVAYGKRKNAEPAPSVSPK